MSIICIFGCPICPYADGNSEIRKFYREREGEFFLDLWKRYIFDSLHSGGFFAFWENNPWNPGTKIVMKRIPFDREAKTMTFLEAREMLKRAGFQILRTGFLFIFPHFLRWFRPLETLVRRFPLGAQYQILCRKA